MTKQEEIRDEGAREKHRTDWIKAENAPMGSNKKQDDVAVEPLIEEKCEKR